MQTATAPRRYLNAQDGFWHVQLVQGETHVTNDPREVLSTILGSCIAACIRDPQAGIGGMNHFLLPEGGASDRGSLRYGVNAMELLINGILTRGGIRTRLEAKLFGGANVLASLSDIGAANARFAADYLAEEGIPVIGGDTGGTAPRRVQFWPLTGRARGCAMPARQSFALGQKEMLAAGTLHRGLESRHDVELF